MRILIYGINYAPEETGVGKYTGELAHWLGSHGHEVRVVTAPPYYPRWQVAEGYSSICWSIEKTDDVRVYRSPLWVPRKPTGVKRLLHLLSFVFGSAPSMFWQVFWRPQVVMVIEPTFLSAPGALLVARLTGSRALLHVQDFEIDAAYQLGLLEKGGGQRAVMALESWVMKRFDRVSTISRLMMERGLAKGVSKDKQLLFPNWVDTKGIFPSSCGAPLRSEIGVRMDEYLVLYSGNMGEKQGLDIVIDAAKLLEGERSIRFVLCGDGAAVGRLRERAEGARNLSWLPLQPPERLNELLNAADIHLLPQRADTADLVMPSKLTGIFASGRPVVATANPGTEVWNVVRGRGITVEAGNVQAFADAIRKLAGDAELRKKLGAAGREYAVAELDKETILSRFEAELIRLVVEGREPVVEP